MDQINVAIADDSIEADEILCRMVGEDDALRLIGKVHTEQEFMQLLREKSPDMVIFDSIVPKLRRTNRRVSITATEKKQAVKYKIPDSRSKLRESDATKLELYVTRLFHSIGIPAHIRGFHYLREGIILSVYDKDMLGSVTKMLYPAVAKKYNTTPQRVERAIRHAIETGWSHGLNEQIMELFHYTLENGKGKPTNAEFIAQVSDKVRLDFINRGANIEN